MNELQEVGQRILAELIVQRDSALDDLEKAQERLKQLEHALDEIVRFKTRIGIKDPLNRLGLGISDMKKIARSALRHESGGIAQSGNAPGSQPEDSGSSPDASTPEKKGDCER